MRGALLALVLGVILSAAGYGVAAWAQKPPAPPGTNPCEHGNSGKPCKPDPQPDHGADCDPHGKGGVNEDHCLDDTTTTTTTTTTPPPPPPPTTTTTTTEETTTSTTPTTSTSPTTTEMTTTSPPSDSTVIDTTTEETTPAGPSPPTLKPKPGPSPSSSPKSKTPTRMWKGKPHPIVRGSG